MVRKKSDKWCKIEDFKVDEAPKYHPSGDEVEIFDAAYNLKIPIFLVGPTGCGKTTLVEDRAHSHGIKPLVTVNCHEDICADDLQGRFVIKDLARGATDEKAEEYMEKGDFPSNFQPGPALIAVAYDGMLYLDEIVEARKDTIVVIHPLADHRRSLTIGKLGRVYEAGDKFGFVMSYNPKYQSTAKNLKISTKHRGVTIILDYPNPDSGLEQKIIEEKSGFKDKEIINKLVQFAGETRNLKNQGLEEGASTRLLIYSAQLIDQGIDPYRACEIAILNTLTDEHEIYERHGLIENLKNHFPKKS